MKKNKGNGNPQGKVIAGVKVYNVQETAEILKVNPISVYRFLKSGRLRGQKIGYGWKISQGSIKAFVSGG